MMARIGFSRCAVGWTSTPNASSAVAPSKYRARRREDDRTGEGPFEALDGQTRLAELGPSAAAVGQDQIPAQQRRDSNCMQSVIRDERVERTRVDPESFREVAGGVGGVGHGHLDLKHAHASTLSTHGRTVNLGAAWPAPTRHSVGGLTLQLLANSSIARKLFGADTEV